MHKINLLRLIVGIALYVIALSDTSFAASGITIASTGSTSYTIQGSNMDGVSGIQLDITYDASSLTSPSVTQGNLVSGAMMATNTTIPGVIKIAIISTKTFTGSGQIAAISFASRKGSGGITTISSSMIDNKGAALASSAQSQEADSLPSQQTSTLSSSGSTPSQNTSPSSGQQPSSTSSQPASSAIPTYLGTVAMPAETLRADSTTAKTSPPVDSQVPGVRESVSTPPATKVTQETSKGDETPQLTVYKGVYERFKMYKGSKGLAEVAALFEKKVAQNITQTPAVLLTTGKTNGLLTIDLPSRIKSAPNFAVSNGKLISYKQDKAVKGRWLVEILPETGVDKVAITILAGSEEFEYPMTVAPVIKTGLSIDAQGWRSFLKDTGTAKELHHDLNKDGVRDYLDEYIFVANYLAAGKTPQSKDSAAPAKKSKKK